MLNGRRALAIAAVVVLFAAVPSEASAGGASLARGGPSARPDAWIKLCGLSLGCTIDPLPHPWRGRDVYNTTGRRQTVFHTIDEGEGIRFWIVIQNDGSAADSYDVDGCRGNPTYEINRVLLGKHERQAPGADDLTRRFRSDTLTFSVPPGGRTVFTLNVITHVNKGVRYSCHVGSRRRTTRRDGTSSWRRCGRTEPRAQKNGR